MQEYDHLTAEIKEICNRYPRLKPDDAFLVWFQRAFLLDSEDAAVNSIVGSSRDKGDDAVYFDEDNHIVFILQGKYRRTQNPQAEDRSDIIAFSDLARCLLGSKDCFGQLCNEIDAIVLGHLEKARHLVLKKNYQLSLQYITSGKVSKTHREDAEEKVSEYEKVHFQVFDRYSLMNLMRDYVEGAAPPIPAIKLLVYQNESFHRSDRGISSWIFSMSSKDLSKLYENFNIRLFARNIRGFLGKETAVNRAMQATLTNEPDNFWYFNNGITIVCDSAKEVTEAGTKYLHVHNAQIINGQQTVRTISAEYSRNAIVLVKLIEVSRDKIQQPEKYSRFLNTIVSATNWQNKIEQSDLRANDPEQVRIEREFKKSNYFYVRKRQSKKEFRRINNTKKGFIVNRDELAIAIGSCVLDPHQMRLGKSHLFEDSVYNEIFNGSKAYIYLSQYWLARISRRVTKGETKKGYARHLAMRFLWNDLDGFLNKQNHCSNFINISERNSTKELEPLLRSIKTIIDEAMRFCRHNKSTEDTVQDESTFFKRVRLFPDFKKHWAAATISKEFYERNISKFKEEIRNYER